MYNTTQRLVNETRGSLGGILQACGQPVGAAYISALQFTVTAVGIVANVCMLTRIFRKRKSKGLSKYTNDVDTRFMIIGFCDICTLVVFPMWILQSAVLYGWVLGPVMCSALKGVTTFCFQYRICTMLVINIDRYVKVTHRTRANVLHNASATTRAVILLACTCAPIVFACLDMYFWTTTRPEVNFATNRSNVTFTICANAMPPRLKIATFWLKIVFANILPIFVLVFCNLRIHWFIRKHMRTNTQTKPHMFRKAQMIPILIIASFLCCWMPWIISCLYYSQHVSCNMVAVLNVCAAIGYMYCIASPSVYMFMFRTTANRCHNSES